MDILLVLAGAGLAAIVAVALYLIRGRNAAGFAGFDAALARIGEQQAALNGRLQQLAEQEAAMQAQLGERLQSQERALAKAVEERLAAAATRMAEGLDRSSQQTQVALGDLKVRLATIDAAQANIVLLSSQVVQLQDVLANKQARGAFGEVQLENLVQAILPPTAYEFQATIGEGKRVDCLLRLPNPPGPIAIDAKFPLEAYEALRAAGDDTARAIATRAFAQSLGKHIEDIARKYIVPGVTAESALMFLPSEAVYAELHANHREIVERSWRARVWIVSPTTLWATLNTVRAVLKDVRMREVAGLIQREVGLLMEDVRLLAERVGKLQRHFDQSADDMRQINASVARIGRRAERVREVDLEPPPDAIPAPGATAPPAVIQPSADRAAE
jgi:DNA recombination protein RmuC